MHTPRLGLPPCEAASTGPTPFGPATCPHPCLGPPSVHFAHLYQYLYSAFVFVCLLLSLIVPVLHLPAPTAAYCGVCLRVCPPDDSVLCGSTHSLFTPLRQCSPGRLLACPTHHPCPVRHTPLQRLVRMCLWAWCVKLGGGGGGSPRWLACAAMCSTSPA